MGARHNAPMAPDGVEKVVSATPADFAGAGPRGALTPGPVHNAFTKLTAVVTSIATRVERLETNRFAPLATDVEGPPSKTTARSYAGVAALPPAMKDPPAALPDTRPASPVAPPPPTSRPSLLLRVGDLADDAFFRAASIRQILPVLRNMASPTINGNAVAAAQRLENGDVRVFLASSIATRALQVALAAAHPHLLAVTAPWRRTVIAHFVPTNAGMEEITGAVEDAVEAAEGKGGAIVRWVSRERTTKSYGSVAIVLQHEEQVSRLLKRGSLRMRNGGVEAALERARPPLPKAKKPDPPCGPQPAASTPAPSAGHAAEPAPQPTAPPVPSRTRYGDLGGGTLVTTVQPSGSALTPTILASITQPGDSSSMVIATPASTGDPEIGDSLELPSLDFSPAAVQAERSSDWSEPASPAKKGRNEDMSGRERNSDDEEGNEAEAEDTEEEAVRSPSQGCKPQKTTRDHRAVRAAIRSRTSLDLVAKRLAAMKIRAAAGTVAKKATKEPAEPNKENQQPALPPVSRQLRPATDDSDDPLRMPPRAPPAPRRTSSRQ